jgi:carboxyl-terminal processing protease
MGGPDYLLSGRRSRRRPPVASGTVAEPATATCGKLVLCGLLFLAGPILRAEPAASDLTAEALPILQANYIDSKKLPLKEGEGLGDWISKSGGTISLCAPEGASAPVPMVTAFLPDNIVYWRLVSFTSETGWPDLAMQLDRSVAQGAEGIVLDLRSNLAPDDYAGAAQVMSFFVPEGIVLFTSKSASGNEHVYTGMHQGMPFHQPIVLITDKQTTGAAEALAACLKDRGALVIGQATMGKAAVFTEERLSSGRNLRYVSAQVCLPNGMELWSHPVTPDIGLTLNEPNEKNALALINQHQVLDVIREAAQRRRLSEAFLVQGENPELDDYVASHEKKSDAPAIVKSTIQDVALIDALDSLKAIRWSQRWTALASGAAPPSESSSVQ